MASQHPDHASFVERVIRPSDPSLGNALMKALAVLANSGSLDTADLAEIYRGVANREAHMYEISTDVLSKLAVSGDDRALEMIKELSLSRSAQSRHNAILCLDKGLSADFVRTILTNSLTDKSVQVRRKAADWIGRLKSVELLNAMSVATSRETDPKTLSLLQHELHLLGEGYHARPSDSGNGMVVTVDLESGRTTVFVSNEELELRELAVIVADLLRDRQRTH